MEDAKGGSTGQALVMGGGFLLFKDISVFITMVVLVRYLSPSDYGSFAFAQSIIGLGAIGSAVVLMSHSLQVRNPKEIDWQSHFTVSVLVNSILFLLTLLLAWVLSFSDKYSDSAIPLAGLGLVFLIDIPGTMRHHMLQVEHNWIRFRAVLILGTLLSSTCAIIIAIMGGGVWALVAAPIILTMPAAIDLFAKNKWRPDFTVDWVAYKKIWTFAFHRMGSGAFQKRIKTC